MSVAGFSLLEDSLLTGLAQQFPYSHRVYPMLPLFPRVGYDTDELKWDIILGARGMAKLVSLEGEAGIIARDGIKQGRATPTHIKEKAQLTNSEISLLRAPGATGAPGTTGNPEQAERAVTRLLQKLRARQFERENWLCTQALVNGSIAYTGDQVQFNISYGFPTLTQPNPLWDDASATIVKDVAGWIDEFADSAGYAPDTIFFNPKMWREYFFGNTQFMGLVKASPGLSEAMLQGKTEPFRISGMDVEWRPVRGQYVNDSGNLVDRWPVNQLTFAALGDTGVGMGFAEWGVLQNMENGFQSGPSSRSWQEQGDSQQIWVLAYDNGLPVFPDQNRVQRVTVA
ncbi:MAG: major capsid protein [Deltaproteobacteria bacterium]|nr:major capsid protein [Deltaproteobacteria bacterium]